MIRREFPFAVLGEREIEGVISNSEVGRDGLRIVTRGIDTQQYQQSSPVLLFQHDPNEPIGRCINLRIAGDDLIARFEFAPRGISPTADRCYGLIKASTLNCFSIGFDPIKIAPPDKTGIRTVEKSTLLECSVVSIPALPSARITARDFSMRAQQPASSAAHCANLRGALLDIAEHHEDCIDALTRGRVPEARRALARAQRATDQANKYAGMLIDTLNTAKAQTSSGVSFGTSDGAGPPGLGNLDKPRATSYAARQRRVRELGQHPDEPDVLAAPIAVDQPIRRWRRGRLRGHSQCRGFAAPAALPAGRRDRLQRLSFEAKGPRRCWPRMALPFCAGEGDYPRRF